MKIDGSAEDSEGIEFYASAFQNGSTIYVYPTYEFTEDKQPCGNDSFSFLLGEAIRPDRMNLAEPYGTKTAQ